MMYRFTLIAFLGALSLIFISAGISNSTAKLNAYDPTPPFSGGVGTSINQDRTGGPLSSGTCSACHGGGSFGTTISLNVFDPVTGTSVTNYVPGNTYEVTFSVSGSAFGYGFQATVLNSSNGAGGTFSSPVGGQIATIGGIPYLEHQGISSTGIFQANWTAPASGSGPITFYTVGMGVNGNGGTSGDQASMAISVSLSEIVPTTIDYPGNPFCGNESSQMPSVTGETNGTYSSAAGLSINSSTGQIDVTASSPGTYTVDYAYSTGTTSFDVTILPIFSSTTTATICANETISFGSQTLDASNAGLNTEVFQAVNGCDSTVELTLTVLPTIEENTAATICAGETFDFNGTILTEANAGLNTAVLQATNGCDSIVNLTLSVENIDITVTQTGAQISSNQAGASYQWINCENNEPILGETNVDFVPMEDGVYAVIITLNNCSDTSACTTIDFLSLDELSVNGGVVFPNPVKDVFEITNLDQLGAIEAIVLVDGRGKVVHKISPESTSTNIGHVEAGVYFLIITTAKRQSIFTVVKE